MNSKISRVLALLLERGNQGLNRFEAANQAHDFVLPSTVSRLHAKGLVIEAEPEDVRGYGGHTTRCARYRIPRSEREHARRILATMMRKEEPAAATTGSSGTMARQRHVLAKE